MADLIDRDKLIQTIRNTHLFDISYGRKNGKIVLAEQISKLFSNIKNQLIAIIISQPPADTERHAHWVKIKQRNTNKNCDFECSCCGEYSMSKTNFCSACGCRMNEVVE